MCSTAVRMIMNCIGGVMNAQNCLYTTGVQKLIPLATINVDNGGGAGRKV